MINSSGLVNDGLTSGCANNGQTVWSYNQGLAIGAFTRCGAPPAKAATWIPPSVWPTPRCPRSLTRDGILTESCGTGTGSCDDNQKQCKGIFIRRLADLADAIESAAYKAYIKKQAESIWATDRDPLNRLGQRWAGTTPNQADWRTQASALEALTAADGL
jgi:hypothetical protein